MMIVRHQTGYQQTQKCVSEVLSLIAIKKCTHIQLITSISHCAKISFLAEILATNQLKFLGLVKPH